MKYLIAILFVFALGITNAQSLSETTGETTSLWNALAIEAGVNPSDWTTSEFRKAASDYAKSIGLEYTNNESNGWNNIEILHHSPSFSTKDIDTVETYVEVSMTSANTSLEEPYIDSKDTLVSLDTLVTINVQSISTESNLEEFVQLTKRVIYSSKIAFELYQSNARLARLTSNPSERKYLSHKAKVYKNDYRKLLYNSNKPLKKIKRFKPKKRMPFLSKKWCNHTFGWCLK